MKFPHGQTVTVIRPAERDKTGDPLGPPIPHSLAGVAIAWGETETNHDGRAATVTAATLYCPAGADILAGDQVTLPGGGKYLVDGQPQVWHSPWTGWDPGVVVRVKGVK